MRLRNTQSYEKKYGSLRSNKYDKVEMKKRENVDFYVLIHLEDDKATVKLAHIMKFSKQIQWFCQFMIR